MDQADTPNDREIRCPSCDYDLRGNTTSVCPECGGAFLLEAVPLNGPVCRPVKGWLACLRVGLIAVFLALMGLALIAKVVEYLGQSYGAQTPTVILLFGTATFLGFAALATLLVLQKWHFQISSFYFGLVAVILVTNLGSDLLDHVSYASRREALINYGGMAFIILASLAGIAVEFACERRSSRTRNPARNRHV